MLANRLRFGSHYDVDAATLMSRMTTQPSGARATAINTLITTLKADGVWAKLDMLYVHAAHTEQAALLNWVDQTNEAINVNSATFTTDQGFTGNGSNQYLNTGIGTSGLPNFAENDCHMGVWTGTYTGNTIADMGQLAGGTSDSSVVVVSPIGPSQNGRLCGRLVISYAGSASPSHAVVTRNSTSPVLYQNGSSIAITVYDGTSAAPSSPVITGLRLASVYSDNQNKLMHAGVHLTATDVANLYAAFSAYLGAL